MTAAQVEAAFPELWASAPKISVERHPHEKAVSRVFWSVGRLGGDPEGGFAAEVDEAIDSGTIVDRDVYCLDGAVIADVVVRHEATAQGIAAPGARFGAAIPDFPGRGPGSGPAAGPPRTS